MYDSRLMWSRTTSAIDSALWRIEATRAVMSCTPPMKIEPMRIHNQRRQPAEIQAGQDRPDDRPGRGDRRKMLAQQELRLDRHIVEIVAQLDRRRRPMRIELEQAAEDAAVDDIGDGQHHRRAGHHRQQVHVRRSRERLRSTTPNLR